MNRLLLLGESAKTASALEDFCLFYDRLPHILGESYLRQHLPVSPPFLVSCSDTLCAKTLNNSLLFFLSPISLRRIPEAENTLAIVRSEDVCRLPLTELPVEAISCGMSSKDAMSFSSVDDDQPVLSLQRSICTLSGQRIDPFEWPLFNALHLSPYLLLGFCTVLLLNDLFDPKHL